MKFYISCDMEGIAGVVHKDQTLDGGEGYQTSRILMTEEVNAAVKGILNVYSDSEIVVNDSHLHMRNLVLEKIDPRVKNIILGDPKALCMAEGLDSSYNAALFIGYHAMVGTAQAVIDHTYYSSGIIQEVRINGKPVGETALNSGIAGYFNVPVIMVSGDDKLAREAKGFIHNIFTAEVKEGLGRFAANSMHPLLARELITRTAEKAVKAHTAIKPFSFDSPINMEVDFSYTTMGDFASYIPGVTRLKGRTVSFSSSDYLEAFKFFHALYRVVENV